MQYFKDSESTIKPLSRLEMGNTIDVNLNIHQKDELWVYDTYRFYDWKEYADWIISEQEKIIDQSQQAIAEMTLIQTAQQLQNEMSIAELTSIIITGGA